MTKREFYEAVKTIMSDIADFEPYATNLIRDDVYAKAEAELEKLDARNAKRASTPSKKAIANEPIKAEISNLLTDEPKTASEIAHELNISVQKCSALLRQIDGLTVTEVKVKGKGKVKGYALG